jgi:hypothetical protein
VGVLQGSRVTRTDQQMRLESQFRVLERLKGSVTEAAFTAHAFPGKWSALVQLAHLTRYHEVFLERLDAMIFAPGMPLSRYNADTDAAWRAWQSMTLKAVWEAFQERRVALEKRLETLQETDLETTGVHPLIVEVNVSDLLKMFLLHEGHHLYSIFQVSRASR